MKFYIEKIILMVVLVMITSCDQSHSEVDCDTLTVVSYGGGSYQRSQQSSLITPFKRVNGITVKSTTWDADYGLLKAMVNSGDVSWDVVEVTAAQFQRGIRENLFEKLNVSFSDVYPNHTNTNFGVPNVYWGTVLSYKASKYTTVKPKSWSDFFDLKKFPGKRALYDDPRANIEFALLADGLSEDNIYPLTEEKIDRAFLKLSTIKDEIVVWWSDGSKPIELLLNDKVVMSSAWNGRIYGSELARGNITISWDGAALDLDYWVIPKGSSCVAQGTHFIAYASMPEPLSKQAKMIGYGPANTTALKLLTEEERSPIPTKEENFKKAFVVNADEWAKVEDDIRRRWVRWRNE